MKSLGIKAEIHVNHRKLANAILDSVQISQKAEVMHEIDKLDKLDEDTVKANLKKYADTNQVLTLFKLLEKDLAFFVSNMFDGADDIIKLRELEKNMVLRLYLTLCSCAVFLTTQAWLSSSSTQKANIH